MKGEVKPTLPFDPFAIAQATSEFALGLAMKPADLMEVQLAAAQQWGDFWTGALSGKAERKAARPPLCLAGMAGRRLLSRDPRCLSARVEAAARRGVAGRRRRQRDGHGQLPARPISERRLAHQFRRDQPGGGQADQGNQRRQSGPGLRQPASRTLPAARASSSAGPTRPRSRRARPSPRRRARWCSRTICSS